MNGTNTPVTRNEKRWLAVFERTEELRRLHGESDRDVEAMVQLLKVETGSQMVRRTLVRNFAAHVEGFVYMLKQVTLALSHCSRANFTKRDLALLEESKSYLDDDGQVKNLKFEEFLENLKFAFKSYAEVNGSTFKLDCRDGRYAYFSEMVQVRHRLIHPKSLKTFAVSDDEMIRIGKAWVWFSEQASGLLNSHAAPEQFNPNSSESPRREQIGSVTLGFSYAAKPVHFES